VIGVVGDTREVNLYKSPYLMAYVPYWSEETPASVAMVLKTDLPVDAVAPVVRRAIHDVDPEIPVPLVQSFSQAIDRAVAPDRFQLMLVSGFAIAAMLLAALGVYGVPAFAVARRSQELGIRLARGVEWGRSSRSAPRSRASRSSPATSLRGASSASIPRSPFEESGSRRA
jgi:putative ABC transport system permease protein